MALAATVALAQDPPPNDAFANRAAIEAGETVQGTNASATFEAGEPEHFAQSDGHTAWWRWTAEQAGTVSLSTAGSAFDTLLLVYIGSALDELELVAEDDDGAEDLASALSFTAQPGVEYQIVVLGVDGATGSISLGLEAQIPVEGPSNDHFADRQVLVTGEPTTGSNVGGTLEANEPAHFGIEAGASAWWTWTAETSDTITLTTLGSDFDTILAVYTGGTLDDLQLVEENDDNDVDLTSTLEFEAEPGTTYHIAVIGVDESEGEIAIRLSDSTQPPNPDAPPNDHFENRIVLEEGRQQVMSIVGATFEEPDEPWHGTSGEGGSVWWTWTAPADEWVTLTTLGSDLETYLAVYSGNTLESLEIVEVADADIESASLVTFGVEEGTEYQIAVAGDGALGSASVILTYGISNPPWTVTPPANDDFVDRSPLAPGEVQTHVVIGATRELGEPLHFGRRVGTVWFTWTPENDTLATVSTAGSAIDTFLSVYSGSEFGALELVAQNDDREPGLDLTSRVEFPARRGTQYQFAVFAHGHISGPLSIRLTTAHLNAPPTVRSPLGDRVTWPADQPGKQIPITVTDAEGPPEGLDVQVVARNGSLLPERAFSISGSGAERIIHVIPSFQTLGNSTVDIKVTDPDGGQSTLPFVIEIVPADANLSPTISSIPNQVIDEDTPLGPLTFSLFDDKTPPRRLKVIATSSDPTLVSGGKMRLVGTGLERSLLLTPEPDRFGKTTITLTAYDHQRRKALTAFELTIREIADPPTISPLRDVAVWEERGPIRLPFQIGDAESHSDQLGAETVSSDEVVLPQSQIEVLGNGSDRVLAITPLQDAVGTSLVTVTVTDASGISTTESFTFYAYPPIPGGFSVSGRVVFDFKHDSLIHEFDVPPEPLAGWKVFLDMDGNGSWSPEEPFAITDESGRYAFRDLTPMRYRIRLEVPEPQWRITEPASHFYHLTGSEDPSPQNLDFSCIRLQSYQGMGFEPVIYSRNHPFDYPFSEPNGAFDSAKEFEAADFRINARGDIGFTVDSKSFFVWDPVAKLRHFPVFDLESSNRIFEWTLDDRGWIVYRWRGSTDEGVSILNREGSITSIATKHMFGEGTFENFQFRPVTNSSGEIAFASQRKFLNKEGEEEWEHQLWTYDPVIGDLSLALPPANLMWENEYLNYKSFALSDDGSLLTRPHFLPNGRHSPLTAGFFISGPPSGFNFLHPLATEAYHGYYCDDFPREPEFQRFDALLTIGDD